MNMRRAILQAADQIEEHPETYEFGSNDKPGSRTKCETPGCALGWIGFFANIKTPPVRYTYMQTVAHALGHRGMCNFFDALRDDYPDMDDVGEAKPHVIADMLRKYADRCHPKQRQTEGVSA